jgi:hypothetical protein
MRPWLANWSLSIACSSIAWESNAVSENGRQLRFVFFSFFRGSPN